MKTKKAAIVLAALMVLLMAALAGCGAKKDEGQSGSKGESGAESGGKLDPYKIVLVYPGSATKDLETVQAELSKYLTEKINATIELRPIDWGAWGDKTNLMKISNEKFDIIFTAGWFGYRDDVAKGQFIELDDLIAQYGKDIPTTVGPNFMNGNKIGGHNYAVPTNKEIGAANGFLFRKDLIDKYKFDLSKVKTRADVEAMFKTIKDNEPGIWPLVGPSNPSFEEDDVLWDPVGPGVSIDIRTGDLKAFIGQENPKYMERMKHVRDWYNKGYINKDAATITDEQAMKMVAAGKAFAIYSNLKPGKDKEMSVQYNVDLVQLQTDSTYTTTDDVTGAMLAISRTSDNPERAMMFMNMLYTDKKLLNMLDWGVEGKHFVKVSDNVIDFPQGQTVDSVGYQNAAWMFGNQLNSYLFKNEDPQKWGNFAKFNETSTMSPAIGFNFNPQPVKNEIAALSNVDKQYMNGVRTGTLDPEKAIPEWLAKQKAAGIDKVLAEVQKQLDEWKNAKK